MWENYSNFQAPLFKAYNKFRCHTLQNNEDIKCKRISYKKKKGTTMCSFF